MKYQLTIWNVLIALLIPYVVFSLLGTDPGNAMGAGYLIPVLIVGGLIDLILQQLIKSRRVLAVVELVSLASIVIINQLP